MNQPHQPHSQLSRRDVGALVAELEHLIDGPKIVRDATGPSTSHQRWRLVNRLGQAALHALVEDRQASLTTKALAEKYHISMSSVKRVVRRSKAQHRG